MNPTAEYQRIIRGGFPDSHRTGRTEPFTEIDRCCPACGSGLRPFRLSPHLQQYRCRCCGLLETPPACEPDRASGMAHHFRAIDPHGAVAASKAGFYAQALNYLDSQTRHHLRVLLDVGCGCGYFLERAAAVGWRTIGVDIVPEMVSAARKRVPVATLFAGDLRGARLAAGSLDAIAMWDVLDMVPDPAAELAECLRLLAPGGVIGIRIRNVAIQLWLYGCYSGLHRLWRGLGIRPLFVFHRYSFSREAVGRLLNCGGFVRISINNSPLTRGDPYSYSRLQGLAGMGKWLINAAAGLAFRLSCGRTLWGPSLLIWAQKPSTGLPGSPLRG